MKVTHRSGQSLGRETKIWIAAPLVLLLGACVSVPAPNSCIIAPPTEFHGDASTAQKIAADLSAFANGPLKADISNEFRVKVDATFQAIPEKQLGCQMLLQTIACLSQRGKPVDQLVDYLRSTGNCRDSSVSDSRVIVNSPGAVQAGRDVNVSVVNVGPLERTIRISDAERLISSLQTLPSQHFEVVVVAGDAEAKHLAMLLRQVLIEARWSCDAFANGVFGEPVNDIIVHYPEGAAAGETLVSWARAAGLKPDGRPNDAETRVRILVGTATR